MSKEEMEMLIKEFNDSIQNLLQASFESGNEELKDLAISSQLVMIVAARGGLGDLKVFLKNYLLMEELEKEDPMTRISKMSLCLN